MRKVLAFVLVCVCVGVGAPRPAAAGQTAAADAIRASAEQGSQAAGRPQTRRSWGRTWAGIAMMAGGLFVPVSVERRAVIFGQTVSDTDYHAGGIAAAVGLMGGGVLLATVWSGVPVRSVAVAPTRGGVRASASVGW